MKPKYAFELSSFVTAPQISGATFAHWSGERSPLAQARFDNGLILHEIYHNIKRQES